MTEPVRPLRAGQPHAYHPMELAFGVTTVCLAPPNVWIATVTLLGTEVLKVGPAPSESEVVSLARAEFARRITGLLSDHPPSA